jgi:uncharacterized protein YbcC (UPF0753/DUF2309 family)
MEALDNFVVILRRQYDLNARAASRHKERITRTGFTLEEQTFTVDTALRMMGLTKRFARLILLCAHGSTSENNPYESALDCGACGGNEGKPNARVLAMIANNQKEKADQDWHRDSPDTFLAGQMTRRPTRSVSRLKTCRRRTERTLTAARRPQQAGELTVRTLRTVRHQALDEAEATRAGAWTGAREAGGDCQAICVHRRPTGSTKALDLKGALPASYNYREDPSNLLKFIRPASGAQWINMEHYFSTVDNDVYGGGNKIYHNVVGRIGIMSGPWSDLRLGLARQTVMNGDVPYHEPMRLLTVIQAPRERIEKLIARHEVLQHFYHNEWVHLVALEPEEGVPYRYRPTGEWDRIDDGTGLG